MPTIEYSSKHSIELNALASAILSGLSASRYWARYFRATIPDDVMGALDAESSALLNVYGRIVAAMLIPGCQVELTDHGGFDAPQDHIERVITREKILTALNAMPGHHPWHRILANGGDADSGDTLLQLAAIGEIVYG